MSFTSFLHSSMTSPWWLDWTLHPDQYWVNGFKLPNQIAEFTRAVDDCSLLDLGFNAPKFTWCNRRFEGNLVYAILDVG